MFSYIRWEKTKFYIALPMQNRSKSSIFEAIKKLCHSLPKESLESFTSDRGEKFACNYGA